MDDQCGVYDRAGERLVVKDTSDPDWWIGSVDGYTGYFPHRYVLPLAAGQRVYQIVKPLHLSHGNTDIKLLRDQVSTQILAKDNTIFLCSPTGQQTRVILMAMRDSL